MLNFVKDYGDTNFITGLRGLAASLVVITHTSAFEVFGDWGREVSNAGQLGVLAFFVIAGFTIAHTRNSASGFREYIIKRFVRLIPLYYAVLLICAVIIISGYRWNTYYGDAVGHASMPIDLLLHFIFLNWVDVKTGNSIIGVEWTLPIEVFWYIGLLPFLKYLTDSFFKMLAALSTLVFIEMIFGIAYKSFGLHPWQWEWSPWQYGWYFGLGAVSWRLRQYGFKYKEHLQLLGVFCGLTALLGAKQDEILMATSTFLIIISTGKKEYNFLNKILTAKFSIFVGTLSYGIYLVHVPIAYTLKPFIDKSLLLFVCTFFLSILLSMALLFFVENPLREILGKKTR